MKTLLLKPVANELGGVPYLVAIGRVRANAGDAKEAYKIVHFPYNGIVKNRPVEDEMPPYTLRLALMIEFLLALIAIFETWSMAGGQGHLDLMPWYAKLGFALGLALSMVMGTSAAVSHEHALNAKTIACLLLALLFIAGMAATTYYYHVHENDDQAGGEDNSITTVIRPHLELAR